MTKLDLNPYCPDGCANFEAYIENENHQMYGENIYIRCKHDSQCPYLTRYLKKRIGKENLNDKD